MQSPDIPSSSASGDGVDEMKEQAKQKTRETADAVRRQASDTAERQKHAAADRADSVAGAFRRTAAELDRQDERWLADVARRCADGADRFAGEMRGKDLGTLVERTQTFARERPATFMAGAVAAGFLLTRFMKSSERHGRGETSRHPLARTDIGAGNDAGRVTSHSEVQSHASP